MIKDRISKIRISEYYYYEFNKYLKKDFLDDFTKLSDANALDMWQIVKLDYSTKIFVTTEKNRIINIPLKLLFGTIEDWDLYSIMAILEYLKPEINYQYYEIGENYGRSKSSITMFDKKIIKSINCLYNDVEIPLNQFAENFKKSASNLNLRDIAKMYFENIDNDILKKEEIEEELERKTKSDNYRAENRRTHSDDFYNENLDLDQQSPEYWDNQ